MPEILLTRCNCVTFLAGRPFWRAECVLMLQAALARSGGGEYFRWYRNALLHRGGEGGGAADSDGTRTSVVGSRVVRATTSRSSALVGRQRATTTGAKHVWNSLASTDVSSPPPAPRLNGRRPRNVKSYRPRLRGWTAPCSGLLCRSPVAIVVHLPTLHTVAEFFEPQLTLYRRW